MVRSSYRHFPTHIPRLLFHELHLVVIIECIYGAAHLQSVFDQGNDVTAVIDIIAEHHGISSKRVAEYLRMNEELVGFGRGGGESLVLYLRSKSGNLFVRKIVSESFATSAWDPNGKNEMSAPFRRALMQAEFIASLPESAARFFPKIYDVRSQARAATSDERLRFRRDFAEDTIYDISYLPGTDLSAFIEQVRPPARVTAAIYRELARLVRDNIHTHRRRSRAENTLEQCYFRKIEQRLELAKKSIPTVLNDDFVDAPVILINRQPYLGIRGVLSELRDQAQKHSMLEAPGYCLTMGDMNTQNIKIGNEQVILAARASGRDDFSYHDLGIGLVDPRAIGPISQGATTVDDYLYDSKFWHNSLAHYDVWYNGHFDLNLSKSGGLPEISIRLASHHPFRESYQDVGAFLAEVMEKGFGEGQNSLLDADPHWAVRFVFLMGTHMCAMLPFHLQKTTNGEVVDDWRRQTRAIALYCEGIVWLNRAAAMLRGHIPATPEMTAMPWLREYDA